MKKLFSLLLAAAMILSLAACGEAPDSSAAETEPPETSAPKTEDGRPVTEVTTVDELLAAIVTIGVLGVLLDWIIKQFETTVNRVWGTGAQGAEE